MKYITSVQAAIVLPGFFEISGDQTPISVGNRWKQTGFIGNIMDEISDIIDCISDLRYDVSDWRWDIWKAI